MQVTLQPDPEDGRNVNVHTTFDESDEQFPQPWRLMIIELQEVHDVASGTEDLALELPREGVFTFEIRCNNSSLREKYATGEAGKLVAMPVEITAVDPDPIEVWTGFAAHDFVLTGTGFTSQGEVGGPNVVMAMLANEAGEEVSSGGGTLGETTYEVSFSSLPPGIAPGSKGFVYTKSAMMEVSSNKFEVAFVEQPPLADPIVTSVVPNSGPLTGGTSIVITGEHLTGSIDVFLKRRADPFTVDSDTQITATTPDLATAGDAAGPQDLSINTQRGSDYGSVMVPGAFTFV